MIELKDLDSLKLVRSENVANLRQTLAEIEHAITQGSQGWGVTEDHAVLLHVAGELRTALQGVALTAVAVNGLEETQNALKGKQLELGRMQARLNRKEGELQHSSAELENANAIVGVKDDKIRELETELGALEEQLAAVSIALDRQLGEA